MHTYSAKSECPRWQEGPKQTYPLPHTTYPPTHLWEPAGKVVHHHRCNQSLAEPRGQADKRVGEQRGLRVVEAGQAHA